MVAWRQYANGSTPQSLNVKGDKFVGDYYIMFDKIQKEQMNKLIESGMDKNLASDSTDIMKSAKEELTKWENNDIETRKTWKMMNEWVYDGFEKTYSLLGVSFDKNYYESDTYLLGKEFILSGLKSGIFYKKDDGSVWCDLTNEGLDEKIVLRADGTAVYMTQDIAKQRFYYDNSFLNFSVTINLLLISLKLFNSTFLNIILKNL